MSRPGLRAGKALGVVAFVALGLCTKALSYDAPGWVLDPVQRFWLTEAVEGLGLLILFLPRPAERREHLPPRG